MATFSSPRHRYNKLQKNHKPKGSRNEVKACMKTSLKCKNILFLKFIDVKTLGDWAVVTGATDGIGLAIAEELVQRGTSISKFKLSSLTKK